MVYKFLQGCDYNASQLGLGFYIYQHKSSICFSILEIYLLLQMENYRWSRYNDIPNKRMACVKDVCLVILSILKDSIAMYQKELSGA